jgi:hypothetical protein
MPFKFHSPEGPALCSSVGLHHSIAGDQLEVFGLRLRDQKAVEGVAVMQGEQGDSLQVSEGDGQPPPRPMRR